MANVKQNKIASRSIVICGTILAGLGIFVAVNHAALPTAASAGQVAVNTPTLNPSFSTADAFLTQSNGPASSQNYSSQAAPARSRVRTRGS